MSFPPAVNRTGGRLHDGPAGGLRRGQRSEPGIQPGEVVVRPAATLEPM